MYFHDYEVWSYRYKEAGVWNSLMSVHFDQQGVVRQMLNGPDPMLRRAPSATADTPGRRNNP